MSKLQLLEEAAKQGHPAAQQTLGLWYGWGFFVTKDYAQAMNYYRLAANQNAAAQCRPQRYRFDMIFGANEIMSGKLANIQFS